MDIWDHQSHTLMPWAAIQQKFKLAPADQHIFELIQRHFPAAWIELCNSTRTQTKPGEWVGIFPQKMDETPQLLFQTVENFCPELTTTGMVQIPPEIPVFRLGQMSNLLNPILRSEQQALVEQGVVKRVRVVITN